MSKRIKLGIFYEVDSAGKDTGRVQVAEKGKDGCVWETFDTEAEAKAYMDREQKKLDRNEGIRNDYLAWELAEMNARHMTSEELRDFLVNDVLV